MIEIGTDLVLVSRMEKSLQIPGFAERFKLFIFSLFII